MSTINKLHAIGILELNKELCGGCAIHSFIHYRYATCPVGTQQAHGWMAGSPTPPAASSLQIIPLETIENLDWPLLKRSLSNYVEGIALKSTSELRALRLLLEKLL